jgi:hypothetical protein
LQASFDVENLPVRICQPVPLLPKGIDEYGWQSVDQPAKDARHPLVQRGATLAHYFALLSQQSPETVDLHRSELHELLPHAMHRQDHLLCLSLYCDRFRWLLKRHPDRPGIGHVILVSCRKRLDEPGRHYLHLMPHFCQPPRPVMRTTACFDSDQIRR